MLQDDQIKEVWRSLIPYRSEVEEVNEFTEYLDVDESEKVIGRLLENLKQNQLYYLKDKIKQKLKSDSEEFSNEALLAS